MTSLTEIHILACYLLLISWVDIKHHKIPDQFIFILVIWAANQTHISNQDQLIGSLWGFYTPIICNLIYSKKIDSIGYGDIKLMMALGGMLGFCGIVICCLVSCLSAILYSQISKRRGFAFAPYLCLTSISLLYML